MTELGTKITLATAEPMVIAWLILMGFLILAAPVHLFLFLKRRLRRPRKPKVSDLLK